VIQNFQVDPDAKASIQLVNGDGGQPIQNGNSFLYAGPTYKDIFLQRIRFGTFDRRDMPNHAFIAILTEQQLQGGVGQKWMKILKENGFEFIRSVSNSVYTGQSIGNYSPGRGSNRNYIFMLVRNIGENGDGDSFTPPPQWADLPTVTPETYSRISADERLAMAKEQHAVQTKIWNDIGPAKLLSEADVIAAGAPVILAGNRVEWAKQQTKEAREAAKKSSGHFNGPKAVSAFPTANNLSA
jgi:hypothetical protein